MRSNARVRKAIELTGGDRWRLHGATLAATTRLRLRTPAQPEVAAHARLIVLDTIGCALAGRSAPQVAALERDASALEPGPFRLGNGAQLGLRPAVQLLAIAPTWHEACEGHAFAHGRPGIATLAALLPLALAHDLSLDELIDAFVLGYEVGARAGGWLRVNPGLHVDGNWPALGAAAAVAALLGLDEEATRRAVDIAACQLPGSLYLPIRTGRNVRNLYLAHSATLGLDAALAAKAGFDAPSEALAHYADHHCRASTQPMPDAAINLLLDAYLKPFAAVRHVHYGAIAAGRIRERLAFETSRIRRIVLSVYEEATVYCNNPRPSTLLAAQFSLTFGVAAMLACGRLDANSYASPMFDDPELRRLEALVEVAVDGDLTRGDRRGARLTVDVEGGGSLAETVGADDPGLDLPPDQARTKFARNAAAGGVPVDDAGDFFDSVLHGAGSTPLRILWALLCESRTARTRAG
jgi:2-methylcitrate dehydratase PrpD